MRLSVVLNSGAGSLLGRSPDEAVAEVEHAFQAAGHHVQCAMAPGHDIAAAIRRAVESDAEVVVVGGGDGTIATAAHILAGTGKALGVLPLGTMNLLARDLGLPLELKGAIEALADGVVEPMDMAEVNGRPFLNNSVLGLYPRMVQVREHHRGMQGISKWPAMTLAFLKTLVDYPKLEVVLETEEGTKRLLTPMLAVANNAYDEGMGPIPARSSLNQGVLGIYVGKHQNRLQFLRLFGRILAGRWGADPQLDVYRLREVTVHSRRRTLRVANDGEVHWMLTPLRYRIVPGGLMVWRPRREESESEDPAAMRTSA
ncbi:diacylglycerol kinase family lipid kinase [Aerophototrophica crusticola]|uniref:Diacylglycerol kinase family lipid kinase n=1 Tax=Aerophototrophica crusticola TaxID=1709002 RepID=A0A858R5L3_9PROT|nr:diacylglycerol kinase family lipid kinase [Rhodospirillaceae bacterium B3]